MNSSTSSILLSLLLFSCTGGDGENEPSAADGGTGNIGAFEDFAPTVFAAGSGRLSVTTVAGNIGCGLVQSFDVTPGLAGEQVFVDLSSGCAES